MGKRILFALLTVFSFYLLVFFTYRQTPKPVLAQSNQCTYQFITKWGSVGIGDGQFGYPFVAVDFSDNVYVADGLVDRIQKFSSSGTFITKWGSQGSADGQFFSPNGIAVDSLGNVYVADMGNHRIQKFSSSGTFITKWGSQGSADGQFNVPFGVAVDSSGSVDVVDTGNRRIQKFSSSGTFITKWGSQGSADGQFISPNGIAVDSSGNVYVADHGNPQIQKFSCINPSPTLTPTLTSTPTNTPPVATITIPPNCPKKTQGDANCDGLVDDTDYNIWHCEFVTGGGGSGGTCISPNTKTADFSLNNKVDLVDFEIWRKNKFDTTVGETTPVNTNTPTPASTSTPTPTCVSGKANCDNNWANGCEANTTKDPNCGSCGKTCSNTCRKIYGYKECMYCAGSQCKWPKPN